MTLAFLAAAGAALLVGIEWRRPQRQHRVLRIVGSVLAVFALALLGTPHERDKRPEVSGPTDAILWTEAESTSDVPAASGQNFALPGVKSTPPDAVAIPDVAYLRREYPQIQKLRIVGDGLEPFDLDALGDVQVSFEPSAVEADHPTIGFVHFPRTLPFGNDLVLQGRIDGLKAGESATLRLEAPDNTISETAVTGGAGIEGTFHLSTLSPAAEGRYLWTLELREGGDDGEVRGKERLGVSVVAAPLPSVLILESSPRVETSHLQRWYQSRGGALTSRTLVGQGRYRFAGTTGAPREFSTLSKDLLRAFDVVISDAQALLGISPEERDALSVAISDNGLGLLALPAGEPSLAAELDQLLPWKVTAVEGDVPENETRTVRIQWPGLGEPLEQPVPVENLTLESTAGGNTLVTDSQGRRLVSALQRGRGRTAVSLVRDTWRWRLGKEGSVFAKYWSFLLTKLARPEEETVGQWTIAPGSNSPAFVHQPIQLRYSGAMDSPRPAEVVGDNDERSRLPLAQGAREPNEWRGRFWPRRAGWHRVSLPGSGAGAHFDFYVHEANEWQSLRAGRRRAATRMFVARRGAPGLTGSAARRLPLLFRPNYAPVLFGLFVLCVSFLWWERRANARLAWAPHSSPASGRDATPRPRA
ncbi:MAG: hypothetical protein H0U88_04810 [Chthoniobacterales bacterium]|nr:hypothetical protein [Chthoniobacterales bacterium]